MLNQPGFSVSTTALWVFLSVLGYGAIHSLLASRSAKALAQRLLGDRARRGYRVVYNLFAMASLLPVLALTRLLPDQVLYHIEPPWSLVMMAVQGLAVVALVVGLLQTGPLDFLGLRQLFGNTAQEPSRLVTGGLYRWVRHPLYTAGLLFIWFIPRMTQNLLALNAGLTVYLIAGALLEERKLMAEYEEAYRRYRESTPMLIPWLVKQREEVHTHPEQPV